MGNPTTRWHTNEATWRDTVRVIRDYEYSGQYMLTDEMGNGLTWLELRDGMVVKIKAKTLNYPGNDYLQPVKNGIFFSPIRID